MKKNKILAMVSMFILILSFPSCKEIKTNLIQDKQVTVKTVKNDNNTTYKSFFREGKEVAQERYDARGNLKEKTGTIPAGIAKEYYENGKLRGEHSYKNGNLEGTSKLYYENGLLQGERNYKNGKLEGISKWYYESGALSSVFNHNNNKLDGVTTLYWENGHVKAEHTYKNGLRNGVNKQYYDNGALRFIYTYKDGKKINTKAFNQTGILLSDQNY